MPSSGLGFLDLEPHHVLLLSTSVCLAFIAVAIFHQSRGTRRTRDSLSHSPPSTSRSAKSTPYDPNKERGNGKWTAVPYTYPSIEPCTEDLSAIKPIPYRPFRWGDYHITMGIRSMPSSEWIELDDQFLSYHRIRDHRIKTRGENIVRILPDRPGVVHGGNDAALELVQDLSEYLSQRYPKTFRIERCPISEDAQKKFVKKGWGSAPPVKSITITPLGVTYELNENAHDMMQVAALLVQDDLALMIEGDDGRYYFQAGAICVGGFWRMQDKIGLPLDAIHNEGNVPQYHEKLETSLGRFFKRLAVDKPVIRNNYFIQVIKSNEEHKAAVDATPGEYTDLDPEELAWSTTTNGPEDSIHHGCRATSYSDPTVLPQLLRLRTERQTLRRLPKSGAILFTIRTYLFPVTELGKERGVPARMANAIRSWPADVAKYKRSSLYKDVLLEYLDECANRQIERGEVKEGEKIMAEYPY